MAFLNNMKEMKNHELPLFKPFKTQISFLPISKKYLSNV